MRCKRHWNTIFLASMFILAFVFLSQNASAKSPTHKVIKFELCADNVKSLGLYKQANGDLWHFVITLNDMGTDQFRRLQAEHFGQQVEIVWVGVEFGKRLLDIVDLSDKHQLFLVSRWLTHRVAQNRIAVLKSRLLHKMNLDIPCGANSAEGLTP